MSNEIVCSKNFPRRKLSVRHVALKYLLPRVLKGGIVGLDEVNSKKWEGETIALKENVAIGDIRLQKFHYGLWVSFYYVE